MAVEQRALTDAGPRRNRSILSIATAVLLLLVPFTIFVQHHGYALLAPEMVLCCAIIVAIGTVLGALMAAAPSLLRALLAAALITLLLDFQKGSFGIQEQHLGWVFLGTGFVCVLLRAHLTTILAPCLTAMLLLTLAMPSPPSNETLEVGSRSDVRSTVGPPIVHIILDEQIGIGGIPKEFDPGGEVASDLRSFYVDRGFEVYSRAYSRYYDSHNSLSTLVNLTRDRQPRRFYRRRPTGKSFQVVRNRYFGEMSERGYLIDVYQTDFIDFCNSKTPARIGDCYTYALETIKSIETVPLSSPVKARIILGMYARLSSIVADLNAEYGKLRVEWLDRGLVLPEWSDSVGRVSALSTMPILELLFARLASIEPGTMVFAHLALPHYPFAYHRDCSLRPDPSEWRDGLEARTAPRRNDARSRAERYPLYLDQVVCTHEMLARVFSSMQAAGTFDESVIIVHGDHGSRLDLGPPYAKFEELLSDTDYVDGFSTLFAVHWPSGRGLSDDRMIPLDVLLASVVREGRIPPGTDWMPPGSIYLPTQRGPMLARDMPEF